MIILYSVDHRPSYYRQILCGLITDTPQVNDCLYKCTGEGVMLGSSAVAYLGNSLQCKVSLNNFHCICVDKGKKQSLDTRE